MIIKTPMVNNHKITFQNHKILIKSPITESEIGIRALTLRNVNPSRILK
jgi:hypothetical protein